jgi:hypothetical protein
MMEVQRRLGIDILVEYQVCKVVVAALPGKAVK